MQLKQLQLRNFCQHPDLLLDFAPGLTGIVGANGSGKSNCVTAARASLTGDFASPGLKEANIRRDAPDDAPAFVHASWEHEGLSFEVMRSLRPSSQKLIIGDRKLTRVSEIADELERVLGVDKYIVENYLFIAQWQLFDFLSSDQATRMRGFARLCQVDKAEKIWSLLGTQIGVDRELAYGVEDTRD